MKMEYKCTLQQDEKTVHWKGEINSYSEHNGFYEMKVSGRGSGIHMIFGSGDNGNFICLPDYSAGCYLANYHDTFWNREALTVLIGPVDAETVVKALDIIM